MILQFNRFWRKCGVRLTSNLVRPPVNPIANLVLPINSHFHYTLTKGDAVGVSQEHPLITNAIDKTVVDFKVGFPENMTLTGKFAPRPFIAKPVILEYHAKNPELRRLFLSPSLATKPKVLMVTNYGLMDRQVRYHNAPLLDYIKFFNYWKGVFVNINKAISEDERHHFFFLDLPETLPSLSMLMRYERGMTREILNKFNTPEMLMVGEFWNWLNGRENTIFNFLNKDVLNRLTIIVTSGSKWTALKLDVLSSWVRGDGTKGTLTRTQLSRRCLNLFLEVTSQALEVKMAVDIPDDRDDLEIDEDEEVISETASDQETKDFQESIEDSKKNPINEVPFEVEDNASDEEIFVEDDDKAIDEDVDRNLEVLEKIHEAKEEQEIQQMSGYQPYKPSSNVALEDGVMKAAQELAEKGKLSPSELRRYEILSKRYLEIPDPYGQTANLAQAMTITSEDTVIGESNKLTDKIDGVLDKSMLESSLDKFDRNYIQKVMRKDIMQTVMQVQRAGIAVQDYQVQKYEDMDDAYEIHTVKLIPVGGKPSTIRFRVPIVNESGVFKTGGVKSRMRKQRADVPIRKVGPSEVALTSYYAKMFVKRSERSVFNYEKWIGQQLTALSLDEESTVKTIQYSNAFKPGEITPRVYSQISRRISGIKLSDWELNFDIDAMGEFFGEDVVKAFETTRKKQILVGKNASAFLIMTMDGKIWQASRKDPNDFQEIGYLETLLGLPLAKRPCEMVELDLFGKNIPLGVVLAFHLGLGNLLETIGADYRKVPKGIQLHLEDDEFDVRFSDMTLVFKRTEHLTTMLMSGFNLYHKSIKPYSVYQFDNPDVYGVIFEENKLGIRYIRELDMIRKLWCDHITAELLVEMNEPTDMILLYLSAVKKLIMDAHPPQMSLLYQRDRGYERFAGMAYSEITRAVRSYNSRPSRQHASVDLNPQAIWLTILQDQTKINIEESNPIHALKEQEIVVFRGQGGRSARSMTAAARVYDESGIGVVSDATVDNGDAGTLTYLTANPNYRSVRGTIRESEIKDMGPSRYLGTSTLLAPGAEYDDFKWSPLVETLEG